MLLYNTVRYTFDIEIPVGVWAKGTQKMRNRVRIRDKICLLWLGGPPTARSVVGPNSSELRKLTAFKLRAFKS